MTEVVANRLYLIRVSEERTAPGLARLTFHTTRGDFDAVVQRRAATGKGVIMLPDSSDGFDGPSSIFPELASDLVERGVMSLRLSYRVPGDCVQCAIDTLVAAQYLDDEAVDELVLVGWSFGAGVALAVGALARTVVGIAAAAATNTSCVSLERLRSKRVLLVHGEADPVAPVEISRRVYYGLAEPRRLIIYPGTGHSLAEARGRLRADLASWIIETLGLARIAA